MPAIHGLGVRFSALVVTYDAGALNDVRVNAGTETFTAAASGKYRKSLLVATAAGVLSEVEGTDADTLGAAVYPAIPADKFVICGVEIDETAVTGLDLTIAGDVTPASA